MDISQRTRHGVNPFTEEQMRGPLELRRWIERVMRLANQTGATFELAKQAVELADQEQEGQRVARTQG